MIAPEKVEQLRSFLSRLTPPMAARLAQAIEVDRLSEGSALPHDLILQGLRPLLRQAETARTATPLRLFSRPFEDLLVSGPRAQKQAGRIVRGSVSVVWEWLGTRLVPDALAAYVEAVKAAVVAREPEGAMDHAVQFWSVASAAILEVLADEAGRTAAREALRDDAVVDDAREMALLLAIGPEVVDIQSAVERPTPALDEDVLDKLCDICSRVMEKASDSGPYVAVVVMNRLERPWEALKLPLVLSHTTRDTLIASTDMGLVGELILGDIESHLAVIRSMRQPDFDAEALVSAVAGFAELSLGMVKEVELRRDGKWGQRLMKARAAVAEIMDGFMERGAREILAALPTQRTGFTGGPRVPDLRHALTEEKHARALAYARLIVGCRPFAAAASFGASHKSASDELIAALGRYNEDLLRELRAAEDDRRAVAETYFDLAAELTALLMSPEEGELLRRRGRAAMTPEAA
jgi:hypothetical protein